jgi:hypothetical protein
VNQHRGLALTAVFLSAVFLSPLAAESLIDQLYTQRQFDLADAYYLAGQKFIDLGQKERGDEFKAKAKHLFPSYVPGTTPVFTAPAVPDTTTPVVAPVATAPTGGLPTVEVVREQNLQGEKIARLSWNKLLRGFLTGNAETVALVLSDTLTLPREGTPEVIPTAGIATKIDSFFAQQAEDGVLAELASPADLYDLASVMVSEGTQPGSVVLSVRAQSSAPEGLTTLFTFWKPTQHFYYERSGDTWKLSAITGE